MVQFYVKNINAKNHVVNNINYHTKLVSRVFSALGSRLYYYFYYYYHYTYHTGKTKRQTTKRELRSPPYPNYPSPTPRSTESQPTIDRNEFWSLGTRYGLVSKWRRFCWRLLTGFYFHLSTSTLFLRGPASLNNAHEVKQ